MIDGNAKVPQAGRAEPGVMVIPFVNWRGLATLYLKEVRRFFKVQLQTVWAPAITTLLFLAIFTVALGRGGRVMLGVPFNDFLAPGLIVMGMIQNAFANSSSSILIGKVQGTIIDSLMPPLSSGELLLSYVAGALTRAWLVGAAIWMFMILWPDVHVAIRHPLAVVYYGSMGAIMLALMGVFTGIWAEKFDHSAAVTNFVVQPLSLLSGTFYTVDRLGGPWQAISHANPFFYIIDGFRYGFIGVSDGPLMTGALLLLAINVALWALCYRLLRTGWKLKA
ncbi:MAG: ABC transporter permease [Sphingomonadaceae bacterium]|nr:ABC transporter permease [Sphingomonadaceae bacterium]